MASHFMDEFEQFASDVREYATEVRRMATRLWLQEMRTRSLNCPIA